MSINEPYPYAWNQMRNAHNTWASGIYTDNQPYLAFTEAVAQYAGRPYHNMNHIEGMCRELTNRYGFTMPSLAFSIIYHDVVYVVGAKDNEEQSARYAHHVLSSWRLSAEIHNEVDAIIMATKHDHPVTTHQEQLIIDLDIMGLGAPEPVFWDNWRNIGKEFNMYTPDQFNMGQAMFLKTHFLDKPTIYYTPDFRGAYEAQARANIQKAVALYLGGK